MELNTYILPAYWASALINDDVSGMEDDDIEELNKWLDRVKPGHCTMPDNFETDFRLFNGIWHDVMEFTFIKH